MNPDGSPAPWNSAMNQPLTPPQLDALRQMDTCLAANAIETFDLRLRNEGHTFSPLHSVFPKLPPMGGYAAPLKIRCSDPPTEPDLYPDRTDWWTYVLTIPEPRVVVIQDADETPGAGALIGEVHAHILRALGCVGAVTNGAVRDLPALEAMGFPVFAGSTAVSHAYVHIIEFGQPIDVGGLTIRAGDLVHGDCHGVLSIPKQIAPELPAVAAQIRKQEERIIALCQSHEFSIDKLRQAIRKEPQGTP